MDISNTNLLEKGNEFVCFEGNKKHVYEWLEFDQLDKEYFYPIFLKKAIFDLPKYLTIISNYD